MGFFDFLKRKTTVSSPDVNIKTDQIPPVNASKDAQTKQLQGIEAIYQFLQADYESRGYNDALVSPDESYRNDNIKLLIRDLEILIQQVTTYYEDMLNDLDFHITSRSRAGLIDLVEELKIRKQKAGEHLEKVKNMSAELSVRSSLSERIVLSYQRGFMRGLSAITQSDFLNKPL